VRIDGKAIETPGLRLNGRLSALRGREGTLALVTGNYGADHGKAEAS